MKMRLFLLFSFLLIIIPLHGQSIVWVEPELFSNKGGWSIDAQFIDQVGTPYLLAHGLGEPVQNATMSLAFPETGLYHVWARTKDWIPEGGGPGKFMISLEGNTIDHIFGSDGVNRWHWEYGGTIRIDAPMIELSLQDITGFDARCDAICFSKEKIILPDDLQTIDEYRNKYGEIDKNIIYEKREFDLVVAGGGVAGICAAVQAARLGLKVALINNRPVLGGNSSSEIKVSMDGSTFNNKYSKLGRIVREIDNGEAGISGDNRLYRDTVRKRIVVNEKNITLFENMHIIDVRQDKNLIQGLLGMDLLTLKKYYVKGKFFADCTGDGMVGIKAGAEYRYGRESKEQTGEPSAPDKADNLVMGTSNQWKAIETDVKSLFPIESWMLNFTKDYHFELTQSVWNWEGGISTWHTVDQAEEIRDHNMRAIYSNWAYIKTFKPEKYSTYKLSELLYMAGKRESYRLMGDLVLRENDILYKNEYPDAVVTTTWGIDLHYPDKLNAKYFPGREFIAYAKHPFKQEDIYTIPYRCFYSKNIMNLFMAGRNISVTHIALGAVRVQRCTGMMGEVVAVAAALCKKYNCLPREVYTKHLNELLDSLK